MSKSSWKKAWTVICATLAIGTSAGAFAQDHDRAVYWENQLQVQMETADPDALGKQEQQLAKDLSRTPNDPVLNVRLGIVYHNLSRALASKGVKGNAEKAVALLEKAASGSIDDGLKAIAMAYWGSSLSLKATEESNVDRKLAYVKQGLETLDRAVGKYDEISFVPRFLRGHVSLAVPEFLKKLDVAGEDFQTLEKRAVDRPNRISKGVLAVVELQLGNYFKKKKQMPQAISAWKKAVALDSAQTGAGKEASQQLAKYTE